MVKDLRAFIEQLATSAPEQIQMVTRRVDRRFDITAIAERLGERCAARSGIVSRWFGLLQCQLLLAQHEASVAMLGASVAPLAVASLGCR